MGAEYLTVRFSDQFPSGKTDDNWKRRPAPFASSEIFLAPIEKWQKLTHGGSVNRVYQLSLDLKDINHDFSPGDTIGVFPRNDDFIVSELLVRLNLELEADKPCQLEISTNSTRKNSVLLPKHLPLEPTTLRNIFLANVDIQTPPKKIFLKSLIKYTFDHEDVEQLSTVTSPKGSTEYLKLITGSGKTLLGLLNTFPSCHPPVTLIFEHLPPLLPRAYSISSSPFQSEHLDVTFSVVEHSDGRKGLCTGWLESIKDQSVAVPFYFRNSNDFKLSNDSQSTPIVMIAAGTGIAPFRSFLQSRQSRMDNGQKRLNRAWLIYGCRSENDCLYKTEIEEYFDSGNLSKLEICFSREHEEKYYVQHAVEKFAADFIDLVVHDEAITYVCGDANTMIKDFCKCFIDILIRFGDFNETDAENYFINLQKHHRFVLDNWI